MGENSILLLSFKSGPTPGSFLTYFQQVTCVVLTNQSTLLLHSVASLCQSFGNDIGSKLKLNGKLAYLCHRLNVPMP